MADSKEKKVMDVAKPEDAKTDIGAKPMIIGHKSLASDPMVREEEKTQEDKTEQIVEKPTEKILPPSQRQKTIAQIEENMGGKKAVEEPSKSEKKIEPVSASENLKTAEESKSGETSTSDSGTKPDEKSELATGATETKTDQDASKDEKNPEIDPVAIELEKQEEVRKLIESKKYFVSIKQARASNTKSLTLVLILVLVLGLMTLFYLVDTNRLDVGFKLPFSLFDNTNTATQTMQPLPEETMKTPDAPKGNEQTSSNDTVTYTNQDFNVSFEYPATWGSAKVEQINGYTDQSYSSEIAHFLDVSFSQKSEVSIRVINGRATEGGRGFESPLAAAQYFQYLIQYSNKFSSTADSFSLIKVKGSNISTDETNGPFKSDIYDWNIKGSTQDTLVVVPKWTLENLGLLPWKDDEMTSMSQADAEKELATLNKHEFYIRNVETDKILGANAVYTWTGSEKDQSTSDQLIAVISSIK